MEPSTANTLSLSEPQASFPYNITFSTLLPKEVILHILNFLKTESDLYRVSLVNWDLQLLSIDDTLWKGIYTQNWIPTLEHRQPYSYDQYVLNTQQQPQIISFFEQHPTHTTHDSDNNDNNNNNEGKIDDEDSARDGEVVRRFNSPGRWKIFYCERKKLKSRKGLHEFIQLLQTLLKHPQQFEPKVLMMMYTTVFSFCVVVDRTREFGFDHKGLYQLLVDLSTQHLQGLMSHIKTHTPLNDLTHTLHSVLVLYRTHWKLWKIATHKVTSIFGYFHRERIAKQTYFEWGAFKILDKVFPEILGVRVMMMKCWYYIVYSPIEEALEQHFPLCNLDNLDNVLLSSFYKSFSEMECEDVRRSGDGERRLNLGNSDGINENEHYYHQIEHFDANELYHTWTINNIERNNL